MLIRTGASGEKYVKQTDDEDTSVLWGEKMHTDDCASLKASPKSGSVYSAAAGS